MATPDSLQLITFDLDDTLWPCLPTILAAEQVVFDWLVAQAPALGDDHDIHSLRDHRLELAQRFPDIAHDLTEVRLRALLDIGGQYGFSAEVAGRANALFREERNRVRPYDEVVDALRGLRKHFVLVALSNGNAQVEKTPLRGLFHHSFSAEQVGAAKPDPALFHAASKATGIALEDALHVGDDPHRDIEAARVLGMQTAWVNRHQDEWPKALVPADMQVGDVMQLNRMLLG